MDSQKKMLYSLHLERKDRQKCHQRPFWQRGLQSKARQYHAPKKLKKLTDQIGINEMSCGINQVIDHEWSYAPSSGVWILS